MNIFETNQPNVSLQQTGTVELLAAGLAGQQALGPAGRAAGLHRQREGEVQRVWYQYSRPGYNEVKLLG